MLGGKRKEKLINELIVVQATFGKNFSSIYSHLIPFDQKILGTIHSHPSESNSPSKQDLQAFAKLGEVHIIIARPFTVHSLKCFDATGHEKRLKIIGGPQSI